jgi:ADP-heptose:LPS heptosyltransferase
MDDSCIVDGTGKFKLGEFMALIRSSNLVVSNDTAPIHIASYMHRPSVAIFGPNTPALYGPINNQSIVFYKPLPCSPCLSNLTTKTSDCRNPLCMSSISVEEVFRQIERNFLNAYK